MTSLRCLAIIEIQIRLTNLSIINENEFETKLKRREDWNLIAEKMAASN